MSGGKQNIFGSNKEQGHFRHLQKQWGEKYNIYHNLPFLNVLYGRKEVVDFATGEAWIPSDEEFELLKKMSIDYVICDKSDKPLVCIEFDGMQNGFNVGTSYRTSDGRPGSPSRKRLLELKLRIAHGNLFPFFVVGSEQFKGLSGETHLTIVDALIGEVFSNQSTHSRVAEGFNPSDCGYTDEDWDSLDEFSKRETIENWLLQIELESDFKHNPIFIRAAELSQKTETYGKRFSIPHDESGANVDWVCVECECENLMVGNEKAVVRLPSFSTPYCSFSNHIAMEIAEIIALDRINKRYSALR